VERLASASREIYFEGNVRSMILIMLVVMICRDLKVLKVWSVSGSEW
jgi:hypothetical protein